MMRGRPACPRAGRTIPGARARPDMNIRFLETFVWLTRLRSFRAAAEKLSTTQPNVSSRLAALEDQLRVKLHVRGAKEFQPTAAGRRLFEYAERILELSDRMHHELGVPEAENAIVRVGILEMVTLSWLPEFVRAIRASDTLTEVDFVTETSGALVQALRRGEIDLAFVWGPVDEPHVANDYVCSYATQWLGSPRFVEGIQGTIDVTELARLPVVPSKKDASDQAFVREYFAPYGLELAPRPDDGIVLDSYSVATSMQLIRTGLAVMAMAPLLMADELRAGTVVALPVAQPLPPIWLTACHHTRRPRPFIARLVAMARAAALEYAARVDRSQFWVDAQVSAEAPAAPGAERPG